MATSPSVNLDLDLGIDAVLAEMDRLVRNGTHPDRISVSGDAAVQWVCEAQWVYYDGPDTAAAARRVDAQLALLRLMLERGADPNKRKHRNSTPLAVCCRQFICYFQERALERLALVLAAGGDPRQTKDPALCIVLGLGTMRGEVFYMAFREDAPPGHADAVFQAVDMLLQAGADVEALDHRGMYRPVLMAAYVGSVPLLRLLKERGADVQAANPDGSNALMYAAGDVDGLANSRAGLGAEAVEWGTLWSTQPADTDTCLAALRSVAGGTPVVLPSQEMTLAAERVHTVMPMLARKAAGRHALNPGLERVAWRAERWVAPITVVTALVGLVLAIVGVSVGQLAEQQRNEGQSQRAEMAALQSRIQAVSSVEAPQTLLPVAEFSRMLDEGARHDPVAFMAVLKAASNKDIRIQRVRLETTNSPGGAQPRGRAFRVDGVVAPGASASVTRWVSQMAAAGWTLKAVDPTYTLPGAFSYELVATAAAPGNVKP
ncbi:hypothetical protein OSTOST_10845 [Ostertagia ostertagi]